MQKILVSACLLGHRVRYDGGAKALERPAQSVWHYWKEQGRLIPACPECAGGLAVPRQPAEKQHDGRILTIAGEDVTQPFGSGADLALALAQQHGIQLAILKANSPSCGNEMIYDGSFSGQLIEGEGVTAQALTQAGIRVFNENQISQAQAYLQWLESDTDSAS